MGRVAQAGLSTDDLSTTSNLKKDCARARTLFKLDASSAAAAGLTKRVLLGVGLVAGRLSRTVRMVSQDDGTCSFHGFANVSSS